jgi:hypothetical protein
MELRTTVTDARGAFVFATPGGTGEYLLSISSANFLPVRRRLQGNAGQSTLEVPITLEAWSATLETVSIVAQRAAPAQRSVLEVGTGAAERLADGSLAAATPLADRITDLARASLYGVAVQGGWSVAGLPASESATHLNGLLFRGATLPRNIPRTVRLSAGTYDVADGGFSGGLVDIALSQAGEFRVLRMDANTGFYPGTSGASGTPTGQGRHMPEVAFDLGGSRRYGNDLGVTAGGRLVAQRPPQLSLSSLGDDQFHEIGLDPSIARDAAAIIASRAEALESASANIPRRAVQLSSLVRIDPIVRRGQVNALTIGIAYAANPVGAWAPRSAASLAGEGSHTDITTQWRRSWASPNLALWDWRLGLSTSRSVENPVLGNAITLILDPRRSAEQQLIADPLLFGGRAGREARTRTVVENVVQREVLTGVTGTHRVKAFLSGRFEDLREDRPEFSGSLRFASLADLEASTPLWSNSTRGSPRGESESARLAVGVGDNWRFHPRARLQYGFRVDAQNLSRPSAIELDMATPRTWGRTIVTLSPRVGLSWNVNPPTSGAGFRVTNLFQRHLLPSGVLRVGAGLFQGDFEPDAVINHRASSGFTEQLWCNSEAIAQAGMEWDSLSPQALRDRCAGSALGGDQILRRQLFSPRYAPPASARATISFMAAWRGIDVELGALWNESRRQTGIQDMAVSAQPSVILPEEGREFYAPVDRIDPTSGMVQPLRDASSSGFHSDLSIGSGRRSRTRQFTVQMSPRLSDTKSAIRLGYVWSSVRRLQGGWDRDAFGNPFVASWGPGELDARHQVQLEGGREVGPVSITVWARGASGYPFSPLVGGDVNGDGSSVNDRAFIPEITSIPTDQAAEMERFMAMAPRRIAGCLAKQTGMAARRGSCRGPATISSSMMASLNIASLVKGRSGTLILAVENLGSLADHILHKTPRGWGATGSPDRILYRVAGFDPAMNTFKYDLNPHFGRISQLATGIASSYRVSLSLSLSLAPPIRQQQVERWLRARGVGERMPADSLANRFARNVRPLYDDVLAERDELFLEQSQLDWIQRAAAVYDRKIEAVWNRLAVDLGRLPSRFHVDDAVMRVDAATNEVWEISRLEAHRLREILTPIQIRLLPWPASALVNADKPVRFQITYY